MKRIKWLVFAALVVIAGCRTSYITSSWKAKETGTRQYNKVLFLGLIRDSDRNLQEKMEEHLAGDLRDMGYNVVTSLKEYGPKAFYNMDEKSAVSKLRNSEIDAVVTIVLLNKSIERELVPPGARMVISDYNARFRLYDYYHSIYDRIDLPAYYITNTNYFWESNFYEMSNTSLLYSVQTKSFDPASAEALGHEYGLMIVKDMSRHQIVEKQTRPPLKAF